MLRISAARRILGSMLLLPCIMLGGCCSRINMVGSRPRALDGSGKVRENGLGRWEAWGGLSFPAVLPSWIFQQAGVTVRVGAENWEVSRENADPSFSLEAGLRVVWIRVEPSGTEMALDSSKVTVTDEAGDAMAPACVIVGGGGGRRRWLRYHDSFTCSAPFPRLDERLPSGVSHSEGDLPVVEIDRKTLIWFLFDLPGSPHDSFRLDVDGLTRAGDAMALPPLQFDQAEFSFKECGGWGSPPSY